MNVQLKSWTPANGSLTRFYITNTETSEQIGYIQTDSKVSGYGSGYYAAHRATKGDVGVDVVDSIQLVGDETTLQAIVNLAMELHPATKFNAGTAVKSLDIQLHRMTTNQPVPFQIPNKAKMAAMIKARNYNV